MPERALAAQEQQEFRRCAARGLELLGLTAASAPLECVQAVEAYVDAWQKPKGGLFAKLFARRPDPVQVALALGAVWGDQLVREFGWQWTCRQADGNDYYCVAAADRSIAVYPTYFVKACLDDASVDCTATLAFNMLKAGSIPAQPAGGFVNLMDGVHRVVPKK